VLIISMLLRVALQHKLPLISTSTLPAVTPSMLLHQRLQQSPSPIGNRHNTTLSFIVSVLWCHDIAIEQVVGMVVKVTLKIMP